MCEDYDAVVMEVGVCEGKVNIKVCEILLIPHKIFSLAFGRVWRTPTYKGKIRRIINEKIGIEFHRMNGEKITTYKSWLRILVWGGRPKGEPWSSWDSQ